MANPIALPGTNVPSGAAVSPGGAQGPSAVSANANNKATLGSDSLVLVQGTAAGVAATTHAQTVSGDDPQLTNARTPTAHQASHVTGSDQIPLASSSTKGLLNQTSGNTTDFIDGTNNSQALQPVIWSARLRSFQALSNNTFEVDQRNIGAALTNPASATFLQDRWQISKSALTGTVNTALQDASTAPIVIPGTNFGITAKFQRFTVGTAQASLAAGDFYFLMQNVEGPRWRELSSDVHSLSLLVRSSVASLAFSVSLRDSALAHSLVKQCTLGAANTWTLIPLPNLPVWSGTYSAAPGQIGYSLCVVLAAGTTYSAAASSAWQTANMLGVTGMSNFLATAGATLDLAWIGHEPGALCTTPQDYPFTQNYDDCLRYFCKSYPYTTAPGTIANNGMVFLYNGANTSATGHIPFKKTMAKIPTLTGYSNVTGAVNTVRDATAGADKAISGPQAQGDASFAGFAITTPNAAVWLSQFHYTADTGW
jgi:hypothetical protein